MADQDPPQSDVDNLVEDVIADVQSSLDDMQEEPASPAASTEAPAAAVAAPEAAVAAPPAASEVQTDRIELLHDVDLHVTIELGRTEMLVEDVLRLDEGSVVELDKLAGDPVDVYVNRRLIARGEVLVLNDNFCIRVSEIVDDLEEQAEAAMEQQSAEAQ